MRQKPPCRKEQILLLRSGSNSKKQGNPLPMKTNQGKVEGRVDISLSIGLNIQAHFT
jgi:hypothetical protein